MKKRVLNKGMLATSFILALGISFAGGTASAQTFGTATIDGTVDGIYGAAAAVQTQNTSFGNANGSLFGGGGELNGLYITNDATNLYITVTGNVEASGNILLYAIDEVADTAGTEGLFAGISGGDGYFQGIGNGIGGTTFPTGFDLDYLLAVKGFNAGGDGDFDWRYQIAQIGAGTTAAFGNFDTTATTNPAIDTTNDVTNNIDIALNNSNATGVAGQTGGNPSTYPNSGTNPALVTTGWETSIPLSVIGSPAPGEVINIIVAYTSGDGNFWSNQILPAWSTQASDHLATDPNLQTQGITFEAYTILASPPPPAGPTVTTNTNITSSPTALTAVSYDVQFSEAVDGFTLSDDVITTVTGTLASPTVGIVADTALPASNFTVNLTGLTGEGTVVIAPSLTSGIQSNSTSVALASTATSPFVIVDNVAPTPGAITPSGPVSQVSPTVSVGWSATDFSATSVESLYYTFNGGPLTQYPGGPFASSPIAFNTSTTGGDGNYALSLGVTDALDNATTATTSFAFTTISGVEVDGQATDVEYQTLSSFTQPRGFGNHGLVRLEGYVDTTLDRLNIAVVGQAENNFNGLLLFIDSSAVTGAAAGVGLPAAGSPFDNVAGTTLDFEADYVLRIAHGGPTGFINLRDYALNQTVFLGSVPTTGVGATLTSGAYTVEAAYLDAGTASAVVDQAWEVGIPFATLGASTDATTFRVMAAYVSGDGGFWSSDVLPQVPYNNGANLAADPNFATRAGDQHNTLSGTSAYGATIRNNALDGTAGGNVSVGIDNINGTFAVSNTDIVTTTTGTAVVTSATSTQVTAGTEYTLNLNGVSGEGTVEVTVNETNAGFPVEIAAFVVDSVPATSAVTAPITAQSGLGTFSAVFSGSATGAAAIASYELFISRNAGAFTSLGVQTSPYTVNLTTIYGAGNESGTYELYTRSTDAFGNVEAAPGAGDVSFSYAFDSSVSEWSLLEN